MLDKAVKREGFAHCYLQLQWRDASWILATRSYGQIRNIMLNLGADCAKQFVRNVKNCGKTNHGFCANSHIEHIMNNSHASTTVFIGLGLSWPFPRLKIEATDERKACCYDWEDKSKIEIGAIGDTKRRVSEVIRGFGKKRWHKCSISEGCVTSKGKG